MQFFIFFSIPVQTLYLRKQWGSCIQNVSKVNVALLPILTNQPFQWLSSAEKFQLGLWFVAVENKAILSLFETYTFKGTYFYSNLGSASFVCNQHLPSLTLVNIMVKLV